MQKHPMGWSRKVKNTFTSLPNAHIHIYQSVPISEFRESYSSVPSTLAMVIVLHFTSRTSHRSREEMDGLAANKSFGFINQIA